MRVLAHIYDVSELHRITTLMHDKGIPTFVRSGSIPWRSTQTNWVVFVCLNSQAEDAARILRDPSHVPEHPVNVDTFERAAYSRNLDVIAKWGALTLVTVAAAFAAITYLMIRYGQ